MANSAYSKKEAIIVPIIIFIEQRPNLSLQEKIDEKIF